jgi:ATP synthase F1 delta subunit
MKITPQQYARLIWEVSQDSEVSQEVIQRITRLIEKNRDQNKIKEIEAALDKIEKREQGFLEVEVRSARELPREAFEQIQSLIAWRKGIPTKKILFQKKLDPNLEGGFILRWEGEILDASVKGKLQKLSGALK